MTEQINNTLLQNTHTLKLQQAAKPSKEIQIDILRLSLQKSGELAITEQSHDALQIRSHFHVKGTRQAVCGYRDSHNQFIYVKKYILTE